jgi:hypothetical protein
MTGEVRIADKPKVSFEPGLGEGFAQTGDAAGNTAGPRIPVRAFKAKQVELYLGR